MCHSGLAVSGGGWRVREFAVARHTEGWALCAWCLAGSLIWMDRRYGARGAPGISSKLKLGSPGLPRRRRTSNGLHGWLISTRFRRAARPIGVTVRVAPVYLVSGGVTHLDGSSIWGARRARHQFEVGLSGPPSETSDVQWAPRLADFNEISARARPIGVTFRVAPVYVFYI